MRSFKPPCYSVLLWRTHSCVPCRHSCRHLAFVRNTSFIINYLGFVRLKATSGLCYKMQHQSKKSAAGYYRLKGRSWRQPRKKQRPPLWRVLSRNWASFVETPSPAQPVERRSASETGYPGRLAGQAGITRSAYMVQSALNRLPDGKARHAARKRPLTPQSTPGTSIPITGHFHNPRRPSLTFFTQRSHNVTSLGSIGRRRALPSAET
jgi:hypothetical protein